MRPWTNSGWEDSPLETYLWQWLQLGARWLHVIAGAAWIGTSFYFNWLNHSLRPPKTPRAGMTGELWSVHGGEFYQVGKFAIAPELPRRLHWFKWEAYATWLSGMALLVLIYYLGTGYLLDPLEPSVGRGVAIAIGVGAIAGGWVVYDLLCRSPLSRSPAGLALSLFTLVIAVAYGLSRALSPRAAFIHVGAMLGTWMAANVFFVIIPGQRAMVRAMEKGVPPDPERGRRAAHRSLHNNYLTLPVLFFMVGVHYPLTYASPYAWLVVLAVLTIGPAVRHYYNLRHQGRHVAWLLPAALAVLFIVAIVATPRSRGGPRHQGMPVQQRVEPGGALGRVDASSGAAEVRVDDGITEAILVARCVPCHSAQPTHPTAPVAPLGLILEEPAQARAVADRAALTIESGTMPLGNVTGMTPEERAVLLRWLRQEP